MKNLLKNMKKYEGIMKGILRNMKEYQLNIEIWRNYDECMKKYEELSPYIWAVGLGKIPSSSSYLGGVGVIHNFQV